MSDRTKPEIGLVPKRIWVQHRVEDILEAIERRRVGKYFIPPEWAEELAEHIHWLDNERKKG